MSLPTCSSTTPPHRWPPAPAHSAPPIPRLPALAAPPGPAAGRGTLAPAPGRLPVAHAAALRPQPRPGPPGPIDRHHPRQLHGGADRTPAGDRQAERPDPQHPCAGSLGLLLSRYSGEPDVVFGTTVSGRPAELPGVEPWWGCSSTPSPPGPRFAAGSSAALAARPASPESGSRAFDHVALSQLQAWSDLPPATSLFDSMVVFENYPFDDTATAAGLTIRGTHADDATSFALVVRAYHDTGSAYTSATTRTCSPPPPPLTSPAASSWFWPPSATTLASDWASFRCSLRPSALSYWRDGTAPRPRLRQERWGACSRPRCAGRRKRLAVTCGAGHLTYAELDDRGQPLRRRLIELGVGPEDRVGILAERSAELVVAVLAAVKAGGAYLPLDVRAPAERMRRVLAEAGARWCSPTGPGKPLPVPPTAVTRPW